MSENSIIAADGANLEFIKRPNEERGNADHGWLKTFHTFNFADYYDPRFEKHGCLRVINEDRVEPKEGFVGKQGDEGVSDEREGTGPTPVHSPLWLYATLLAPGKTIERPLNLSKGYLHVVQTSGYNDGKPKGAQVKVSGALELGEGDGAFISNKGEGEIVRVENVGDTEAELLLFDLD
ncbi:hypothetical protein FRB91_011910 [Serendipita sp. 411]|nr:hypothetical protein FRB91_011910 [Serendipita sp. 411]